MIVLGDESGYEAGIVQKMKLAAIEAEWDTYDPPATFTLVGFPDMETMETRSAVRIPYVLGLIATRSIDEPVVGIKDLIELGEARIRRGMKAYGLLKKLKAGEAAEAERQAFDRLKGDLGYGLLLKRYTANVTDATEAQIRQAARDTMPNVPVLFWTFRIMVGCGFLMLALFILAFYYSVTHRYHANPRWLLYLALFSIPLPWIAAECGWIVAEYGRQPWSIGEILPTFLSVSSVSAGQVIGSLIGFVLLYTALAVVDVYLMVKYARIGPSSLHTGRYHHEHE